MKKVKSVKMKPRFVSFLKNFGFVLCIILGIFLFYRFQISSLKKLDYSEKASNRILFSHLKSRVIPLGKNKTLNAAFENDKFDVKYFDNYSKIKYVDQVHFIENIHKFVDLGYSNNDINIIFSHGDDSAVSEFTQRDRVHYLEEFYTLDFAKIDKYDRYVHYSDETGDSEYDTVIFVNLDLDKDDYFEALPVNDFSVDMLVNKHRYLNEDFTPPDLVTIDSEYASSNDFQCSHIALNAFIDMYNAALKDGYSLIINSAYRSYQDQTDISNEYLTSYGQAYVDKYVAKPGYSEHQTGLAFDIGSRNSSVFQNSREYGWLKEHAHEYGFILRYDEKNEDITGFRKEPWHYRYVGKDIANYIYQHNNMSLEEYYVLFINR